MESRYVNASVLRSTILNIENDDKMCFIWSILDHLHPITDSKKCLPTGVSKFDELNIHNLYITNEFSWNDVHQTESLKN